MAELTKRQMEILARFDGAETKLQKGSFPGDDWRRIEALERRGLLMRFSWGLYAITPAGREALKGASHDPR